MNIRIKQADMYAAKTNVVILAAQINQIPQGILTKEEEAWLKKLPEEKKEKNFFHFNKLNYHVMVCIVPEINEEEENERKEKIRKLGSTVASVCKSESIENLTLSCIKNFEEEVNDFLEGLFLSHYNFEKYKSKQEKKKTLSVVTIAGIKLNKNKLKELQKKTESVFIARNWVNEPGSSLTPLGFTKEVSELFANIPGVKTEIFSPRKISSLKMAGIEAVSKGGPNPPAFIVLEYIPQHLKKQQPIVLVGKGIFFDTGGINLKPGAGLADMKCDMSGAAAVASAMYLIASMNLDVPVVGLIPATENRPGNIAYLPGDVITMMNGVTVEVKNTDAEGRMILADALCYAKKYNPAVAITIATLTGSAHSTFGHHAIAGMQNKAENWFSLLKSVSFEVHERIAELPMWKDYEDMIESGIADIQNIGGKYAGAITAAKFLQKFTDYPFIHLDIAGPAFTEKAEAYVPAGGTGVGVRLFYAFLRKISQLQG